jgi:hypothetical protein
MTTNQPFLLRFTSGPMSKRQFTLLPGESYVIGCQTESDIRVDGDPTVSRRHACIRLSPKGFLEVIDLGSTNGTFIATKRIKQEGRLKPGVPLQLGANTQCVLHPWNVLDSSLPPGMSRGFDLIPSEQQQSLKPVALTAPLWFTVAGFCVGGIGFGLWQISDIQSRVMARTLPVAKQEILAPLPLDTTTFERIQNSVSENPEQLVSSKNPEVPLLANNFVWDEIINISQRFGAVPPSAMDPEFVKQVEDWIQFYTKNNRHVELIKRRDAVWNRIQQILQSHGLPSELGYIAWVESAFDSKATSHAGAVGMWQFIASTAAEYGLSPMTGDAHDQRRQLEPSTHAAARYLNSLLQQFGNRHYLLALAAYNVGQNKVKRHEIGESVRNARQVDFWQLRDKLPKETQDYVPKVLAAIIIGRNPDFW